MRSDGISRWMGRYGGFVAAEVGINIILPIIIFDRVQDHCGTVSAVIASSIPPTLWSIFGIVKDRKLDVVSSLVLLGIALSFLTFLIGGSPKLLLMRDNLGGALFGLLFLGSAALGRPLMYEVISHFVDRGGERRSVSDVSRDLPAMKREMTVLTIVFGLALIAQTIVSAAMIAALSIHTYLIYGPIIGWAITGGFLIWCIPYYQTAKKRANALPSRGDDSSTKPSMIETPSS